MNIIKRIIAVITIICATIAQTSCSIIVSPKTISNSVDDATQSTVSTETSGNITPHLLQAGDVIDNGGYFYVGDVKIQYSNGYFAVTNNSENIIRITCNVVGTKTDGTYEWLQTAGFSGIDQTQYNRDLEDNGWAVEHYTDLIRPGETLHASLFVSDLDYEDFVKPDINNDGYYELMFTISPQSSEDVREVSSTDPVSSVFKLPVNQ